MSPSCVSKKLKFYDKGKHIMKYDWYLKITLHKNYLIYATMEYAYYRMCLLFFVFKV